MSDGSAWQRLRAQFCGNRPSTAAQSAVAFDTTANEVRLSASRIGVLLIHGLTGTPQEMKSVAKRLHHYGFTVYCPCLAGHCGDEAYLLASGWRDWVASVRDAYQRLAQQCDVIFIGGMCAGAILCLQLAEEMAVGKTATPPASASPLPPIRAQALYSLMLRWDGWSIPRLAFLLPLLLHLPYFGARYRFYERDPYGLKNERLRHSVAQSMHSGDSASAGLAWMPGAVLSEQAKLTDRVFAALAQVDTPSLLLHSRYDDIAHPRNAEQVLARLGGEPNSHELLLLNDSYHLITVDQQRRQTADLSARFFADRLNDNELRELSRAAAQAVPARADIDRQLAAQTPQPLPPYPARRMLV